MIVFSHFSPFLWIIFSQVEIPNSRRFSIPWNQEFSLLKNISIPGTRIPALVGFSFLGNGKIDTKFSGFESSRFWKKYLSRKRKFPFWIAFHFSGMEKLTFKFPGIRSSRFWIKYQSRERRFPFWLDFHFSGMKKLTLIFPGIPGKPGTYLGDEKKNK